MSHKSITVISVMLFTFVAGCAPLATWRKDGASQDVATSALSECKYQIGLNKISEDKMNELVSSCMQGKGFRWH